MKTVRTVCPLNCFDTCSLLVQVDQGQIVGVKGDPTHPQTRGFACTKAKKMIERLYSPDRILSPMLRQGNGWQKISWDRAFQLVAAQLNRITGQYGSQAILHIHDSGSNGLLRDLDRRFFNCLGGVTVPNGDLCWGEGHKAQDYDFGGQKSHTWDDLLNSRVILLWGRDPATTNIHLVPFLRQARETGAKIVLINPIPVRSSVFADVIVSPRPGTDGALALGMAYYLLENRLVDLDFIRRNVLGFEQLVHTVKEYPPQRAAEITGVPRERIEEVARLYGTARAAAIILGYGLQRYANGGHTVRAIDALAVLTGNVGKPGGGVNYSFSSYKKALLNPVRGDELGSGNRTVSYPNLGLDVLELDDPPVKAIFVTRANPVAQLPNTGKVVEAFARAEFVVAVDFSLTDTARRAHLVLPCTTVFEGEDVVANGMNYYLGYAAPVIRPRGEALPDPVIFSRLAQEMGLSQFGLKSNTEWLRMALGDKVDLEEIKAKGWLQNPLVTEVAWADKKFNTPSGKIELYSQRALEDGLPPVADYRETKEAGVTATDVVSEYPLHFLTPHPKHRLHSQFHDQTDLAHCYRLPFLRIHPAAAKDRAIRNHDEVVVESPRGEMRALALVDNRLLPHVVVVEEGWWLRDGACVNFLTSGEPGPFAGTAGYYDCLCQVRKVY